MHPLEHQAVGRRVYRRKILLVKVSSLTSQTRFLCGVSEWRELPCLKHKHKKTPSGHRWCQFFAFAHRSSRTRQPIPSLRQRPFSVASCCQTRFFLSARTFSTCFILCLSATPVAVWNEESLLEFGVANQMILIRCASHVADLNWADEAGHGQWNRFRQPQT